MSKLTPFVINEADMSFNQWDSDNRACRGMVQWKTLVGGGDKESQDVTFGIAQVPCGLGESGLKSHQHEQAEGYYIISGIGFMMIDNKRYEVRAGDGIFIPANAIHSITNTGDVPLKFIYILAVNNFSDVNYIFKKNS